ncbi:MAG: lipid-A-disaccharide synthase, partial [Bdellovibrionales bacterium RBG_16_40_8]
VLRHYTHIKKVFHNIVAEVARRKPKVILLLDYPDFNLRLAKKLKKYKIPIVYYISPQVWAWRKSRLKNIKENVDKMLVVLPFEKDFYKKNGVSVEFVGHPLLDELKADYFDGHGRDRERERYGVTSEEIWIGLMPGSRHSELRHHLQTQLLVAEKLYSKNTNLKFALLVAPTFSNSDVQRVLPGYSMPLTIIQDEPMKMISLIDIALCASGTATLIVGLLRKPMVIMYKMNAFSAFLARQFVKGTPHFGLINLILGRRVVAELFQNEANVLRLTEEIKKYIDDKKLREVVAEELSQAEMLLGTSGATARVAEKLKPMLF